MSKVKGKWVSRRAVFAASGGALAAGPALATSKSVSAGRIGSVDPLAPGNEVQIRPVGVGAVPRPLASIVNDWSNSVLSYGAVGDAVGDDTPAFQQALAAYPGKQIFVPPGRVYRLGAVGGLGAAGTGITGVAGHTTIIKPVRGFTRSIFFNPSAGNRGSAYGLIRDLRFDLEGEECVAVDLSHCDTFVVERVNGRGGARKSTSAGTLVKFGAPSNSSSYNNVVRDCAAEYFDKAVIFGTNANQNRIEGGTFTNNIVAFDCAPGGDLARPQLLGVRIEGNGIGVKEGAQGGVYLGYFENNSTGDFSFTEKSDSCVILPGTTTAASATPLYNRANASNLRCLSYDLGYYDGVNSSSNPAFEQRRQIRTTPGSVIDPSYPNLDFTDLHMATFLMGNGKPIEGVNKAGTNSVVIVQVNASDEVEISGYDRMGGAYRPVNIGGGSAVRPNTDSVTDLGSPSRQWKDVILGGQVVIDGVSVLGPRAAAVTDATDAASAITQLNALLARLRAHGLIAT